MVPVQEETSGARYLETSLDALRNLRLGGSRTARLTLGYRHERVDPLFRSLGAHAQADRLQDHLDVRADVAGIGLQAGWGDSRNNLGEIRSILTTRTGRSQVNVSVPLARVLGRTTPWLPSLQYRSDRTRQSGDGIPVDGGFNASHVPDQVSLNRTAQADWQFRRVTLGYLWNRSHQDNRQPGRENADLTVTRHSGTLRLSPHRTVSLGVELGLEESRNLEREETDETARWGVQLQWQPLDRSALSIRLQDTSTEDLALTRRRSQEQVDVQWSSFLPWMARVQGQYTLRFARSGSRAFDARVGQDDRRRSWWLDSGLNFTFF